MKKKSQIAIEFLLLIMTAFFITMVLLIVTYSFSVSKNKEKTFYDVDDFGKSIQQEFIIASEVENGYVRKINIPETINGLRYNISLDHSSNYTNNIILSFDNYLAYFVIPAVLGDIAFGDNYIIKNESGTFVNH